MILTQETYFSKENQQRYFGTSQFKSFMKCEAMALAELNGEYEREKSTALLQGQYLDSLFEGTNNLFEAKHNVFKKNGEPYAEYLTTTNAFERIKQDAELYRLSTGKQQQIFTGVIQGVEFKIMIDSLLPDMIVDRKFIKDFGSVWADGESQPWWQAWGYHYQAAIYQYIYEQNTGDKLPFVIAGITKEKIPDIGAFLFSDETIHGALQEVIAYIEHFKAVKDGIISPTACGVCDYCKSKKTIEKGEYELI